MGGWLEMVNVWTTPVAVGFTAGPEGLGAPTSRSLSQPLWNGIHSSAGQSLGLVGPKTSPWLFGEEAEMGQASQGPEVTDYF